MVGYTHCTVCSTLMVAFLSGNLAIRMDRLEVGYTHCKVFNTLMVAFLSGNLAIRMDRLEVQVAAAPTPFEKKNIVQK
jgi:hypothetical protein